MLDDPSGYIAGGGPLLLIGNVGVLFGLWDRTGPVSILVVPEFLWELFLGIRDGLGIQAGRPDPFGQRTLTFQPAPPARAAVGCEG